jgi:hypothetical protein
MFRSFKFQLYDTKTPEAIHHHHHHHHQQQQQQKKKQKQKQSNNKIQDSNIETPNQYTGWGISPLPPFVNRKA